MKKRILATMLAGIMAAASMTCAVSAEEASGEVVLKVLTPFDTNALGEDYVNCMYEAAEECGITLEYENINAETYKTDIKVLLAGNEMPDVFFTWGDSYTLPFIEAGAVLPLNDAIANSGYEFYGSYVTPHEDGNLYTAPYTANDYEVCLYNKSVFEELGLEIPKTYDDLLAIVDKCNEAGIAAIGLANGARWEGDNLFGQIVLRQDPNAFQNAMYGDGSFTDEPFLKAAAQVLELREKGAFQTGYMQADGPEVLEMFYAGQIAIYPCGSFCFPGCIQNMGDNLGYFDFPNTGDAANTEYAAQSTVMFGTLPNGLCVSSSTKYPEEAAKLAVTYSKKINDALVRSGRLGFMNTDAVAEVEVNGAYQDFMAFASKVTDIQPWWFGVVDASIGEPMRDLSHKLYGGDCTAEEFTAELETVMKPE